MILATADLVLVLREWKLRFLFPLDVRNNVPVPFGATYQVMGLA
jgi:hypothetical protein